MKRILMPVVCLLAVATLWAHGVEAKAVAGASRCLIPSIMKEYDYAVKLMDKDIQTASTTHPEAVTAYKSDMAIILDAIKEPYCGYGSRGTTAVKKSLIKSLTKTRDRFLAAVKKDLAIANLQKKTTPAK